MSAVTVWWLLAQGHPSPWLGLPAQIAAALGGLAGITALITGLTTRKEIAAKAAKTDADAAAVLSTTAIGLVGPMQSRMDDLNRRASEAEARAEAAERRASEAEARIRRLEATVEELTAEIERVRREASGA